MMIPSRTSIMAYESIIQSMILRKRKLYLRYSLIRVTTAIRSIVEANTIVSQPTTV